MKRSNIYLLALAAIIILSFLICNLYIGHDTSLIELGRTVKYVNIRNNYFTKDDILFTDSDKTDVYYEVYRDGKPQHHWFHLNRHTCPSDTLYLTDTFSSTDSKTTFKLHLQIGGIDEIILNDETIWKRTAQ